MTTTTEMPTAKMKMEATMTKNTMKMIPTHHRHPRQTRMTLPLLPTLLQLATLLNLCLSKSYFLQAC
jgi:hypothetical protein